VSYRRKLRSYEVERAFYASFAARCAATPACRVPRPLALEQREGGWLFVLEDLDASGFSERHGHAHAPEVVAGLRWLARFHARFVGTPPEGLWKIGTYWHLATRPDELARLRHAPLKAAAGRIDARLNAARFKTLVHGDAKLENVCFSRHEGDVALVDFQYVGGGVGVKDVAYFLNCVVAPRACAAQVPHYLDAYFRELRGALASLAPSVDAGALEREWRELFPLAWVDFYRFLLGWAPGQFDDDPYSERLTREVLDALTSA
jgi:aminoglycoside phosphotransferase (APT) family kinase protein